MEYTWCCKSAFMEFLEAGKKRWKVKTRAHKREIIPGKSVLVIASSRVVLASKIEGKSLEISCCPATDF